MRNIHYTDRPVTAGIGPVVIGVALVLCLAAAMLLTGIGPAVLAWALLAFGVFIIVCLVRYALDPTLNDTHIIANEQILSIQLPGRKTRLIPLDRISHIVGIAHRLGLAHGGDEVDFEIHWDGNRLRVPEEILFKSGLRRFLCELPQFDRQTLLEAQGAALHGKVPLWGKRFVLMQQSASSGDR